MSFKLVLVIMALAGLFVCAMGQGDTAKAPSLSIVAPQENIKVMTYNIFNGAGVDPIFEKWAKDRGYPGNRLSKVLEIIKAADPDILGIQEAAGWDKGDPTIIERVADELGMNYSIGKCIYPESGFNHVALLTRFSINEADDYSSNFRNAALRVEVVTPQGRSIQVFVTHLIPPFLPTDLKPSHTKNVPSYELYDREVLFLVEKMKPYTKFPIILMGDMNKVPSQIEDTLNKANLSLAADESKIIGIDSVWVTPTLIFKTGGLILPDELTQGASDHLPLVAEIYI